MPQPGAVSRHPLQEPNQAGQVSLTCNQLNISPNPTAFQGCLQIFSFLHAVHALEMEVQSPGHQPTHGTLLPVIDPLRLPCCWQGFGVAFKAHVAIDIHHQAFAPLHQTCNTF